MHIAGQIPVEVDVPQQPNFFVKSCQFDRNREICYSDGPVKDCAVAVNDMKEANIPEIMNETSHNSALAHGLNGPYSLMGEAALCSCSHAAAL